MNDDLTAAVVDDAPAGAPAEPAPLQLRTLLGSPPPDDLAEDIAILGKLSATASQKLYAILGPCLAEVVPASTDRDVEQFCRVLGLDGNAFARGLRAARFLIRQAAMLDLAMDDLRDDLAKLGDDGTIASLLSVGYDEGKDLIRREAAQAALANHGKLVERVDWRLDYVATSDRAENLKLPVVVMTLRYREGDKQERVTLQLLPDTMVQLRAMCSRLL